MLNRNTTTCETLNSCSSLHLTNDCVDRIEDLNTLLSNSNKSCQPRSSWTATIAAQPPRTPRILLFTWDSWDQLCAQVFLTPLHASSLQSRSSCEIQGAEGLIQLRPSVPDLHGYCYPGGTHGMHLCAQVFVIRPHSSCLQRQLRS